MRPLAKDCNFANARENVSDAFVLGLKDSSNQEKLLPTSKEAVETSSSMATASVEAKQLRMPALQ